MKIIAHRGASAERPENTLAAFERALAIGVDGIEGDVLVTKDRRLVVRHDDLIQKDTTWHYVRELTFEELQAIDVGAGEQIPSLEMVFERFYGRCPVVLDVKDFGIAELLTEFLLKRRAHQGVRVTSFLHSEVVEMGRRCPGVERSIILGAMPVNVRGLLEETNTRSVALYRGYLNEAITRHLVEMGIEIWAYTVNLPREAQAFASWGIEAIYTDDPAAMQSLRKRPTA